MQKREPYLRRTNLRRTIIPPPLRKKAPPPILLQKKTHIQIRPPNIPRLQPKASSNLRKPKPVSAQKLIIPTIKVSHKLIPPVNHEKESFTRRKRPRSPSPDELYQPQHLYKKRRTRRHIGAEVLNKPPRTSKTPKRVKPIRQSKTRTHSLKRPIFHVDGGPDGYCNQALCWRTKEILIPDVHEIIMDEWPSSDEELCLEGKEDTSDRAYFLRHYRAEKREKLFYAHLQKWRQQEKEQAARDSIENTKTLRVLDRPKGPWQFKLKENINEHIPVPDSIDTRNLQFNYKFTRPWRQPMFFIKLLSKNEKKPKTSKFLHQSEHPIKSTRSGKDISDLINGRKL